jgi:RimJ/RimL family protein N-acetyltransferase
MILSARRQKSPPAWCGSWAAAVFDSHSRETQIAMTYRIVPITVAHIPGFRAAVDSVAREHLYLAMLEAPPANEVRKFVLGNIRNGAPQLVAIADETIVGWCDVLRKPRETLKHSAILGIGVVKPYRGRGIGKSLIESALQSARASGITRIELTVRTDNAAAKKLYESCGFVDEGICRRYLRIGDEYKDCYLMALLC